MKRITSLFMMFFACSQIYAQKIETFNYPVGDKLTSHNWTVISGSGRSPIQVDAISLNAIGSIKCKSIKLSGVSADESVKTPLGEESGLTEGKINKFQTLYTSFPVKISAAPANNDLKTDNYFFANYSFGTNYRGKVYAQVIDSKLQFGVAFGNTSAENPVKFTTVGYKLNTTYQLVVKLNQNAKIISLYVSEAKAIPADEPAVPAVTHQDINANANGFQYLAFRQVTGLNALVGGLSSGIKWPSL